jgi:hypothetical protein
MDKRLRFFFTMFSTSEYDTLATCRALVKSMQIYHKLIVGCNWCGYDMHLKDDIRYVVHKRTLQYKWQQCRKPLELILKWTHVIQSRRQYPVQVNGPHILCKERVKGRLMWLPCNPRHNDMNLVLKSKKAKGLWDNEPLQCPLLTFKASIEVS